MAGAWRLRATQRLNRWDSYERAAAGVFWLTEVTTGKIAVLGTEAK
jgi:hypothetical protein